MVTLIGIIEDNESLRKSVGLLFETNKDFHVVLSEGSCDHIVEKLGNTLPQLLLMDIDMPGMNGIEGVRLIKQHFPAINVIMFTVFEDDEKIFNSLMAGASGYILKKSDPLKIIEALQELRDGGAPMSPAIAQKVIRMFRADKQKSKQPSNLSKRETDILNGLTKGYTYKELATEYGISVETVRSHLKNIYEKLHVHSKSEAVAKALKENII
jgi:DNA-binding NarL/FixJ family response regulator